MSSRSIRTPRRVLLVLGALALSALPTDLLASKSAPPKPIMVLAGASGRTGREVLVAAAKSGWRVRALTSDLARAQKDLGNVYRLGEWHDIDLGDDAALGEVMRGADHVVTALGAHGFKGKDTPDQVDFLQNSRLIDAAVKARVRHFVFVSSGTAGTHKDQAQSEALMNVRFWKTRAEEQLRSSGLAYTIIGPGGLTQDAPRKIGLRVIPREQYVSTDVSRADVARVALFALRNPAASGKSFALINDRNAALEQWQTELQALPADRPAADSDAALLQLSWMAGHWVSRSESGSVSDEAWFSAAGGLMLGMGRTVPAGKRAGYELMRIEGRGGDGVFFSASPQGQPWTDFRLTTQTGTRASFFNMANDFPQGVHYWREGDELLARIDGVEQGRIRSINYRFQRRN